eukprot:6189666-Lingulodinium_polyedra.AAC.1
MPHVGDMEPVYPLVVDPVFKHGAVELGWPSHLAMLLPEVTTQVQNCYTYVTISMPPKPRFRLLKGMMTTLHHNICVITLPL